MTEEQVKQWAKEYEIAEKSGSEEAVKASLKHRDKMMLECIQHQATRVKQLTTDMVEVKRELSDIKTRMVDIATSRAVLTEKYDATTTALNEMRLEMAEWRGAMTEFRDARKNSGKDGKDSKEGNSGKRSWWEMLMSPTTMFFTLVVLFVWAFIYLTAGQGGVNAAKGGFKQTFTCPGSVDVVTEIENPVEKK